MSSSIDFFECPKCSGQASREQDNRTYEVHISCKCGWDGNGNTEAENNEEEELNAQS